MKMDSADLKQLANEWVHKNVVLAEHADIEYSDLEKSLLALLESVLSDRATSKDVVGNFESEARPIEVDKQNLVAVWTDGVMLSADNGNSKLMPGISDCAFQLAVGKRYKVTVEKVELE